MPFLDMAPPCRLADHFGMAAVQILMMMGLTMSQPLLPLFLEKELGLARGQDVELWSGLIAASSFLTVAIFTPIWGGLADRYGRRIMVIRSTAAVGVFNLLVVLVTNQYQLLVVRLGMGVLSGFGAAATSLVGSVAPRRPRGSPTRAELAARPGLLRGMVAMARSRDLVVMFVVLALNRLTIGGIGPITSLYVGELAVRAAMVPTVAGLALSVTATAGGDEACHHRNERRRLRPHRE